MFENSIAPVFAYGDPVQDEEILDHNYRLAFDTSHCFIRLHGANRGLPRSLCFLQKSIVHYHLVDSRGQTHDSLPRGQGSIDWDKVLPLLNPQATSIYENRFARPEDCHEQLISHRYLQRVAKQVANHN